MKKIVGLGLLCAWLMTGQITYAQEKPWALVEIIRGKVTYDGKQIAKGQKLNKDGTIEVSKKSFVKIKVHGWENTIVLGPRSAMKLSLTAEKIGDLSPPKYTLVKGACRWAREKLREAGENKDQSGGVHTSNAAMGVRGTDFYVKVNPLMGETEIVVFDGEVEFTNKEEPTDRKNLTKGQWGGLGGRYGKKIGDVLDLSGPILEKFNKKLNI